MRIPKLLAATIVAGVCVVATAADKPAADTKLDKTAAKEGTTTSEKDKTPEAKLTGRLPAYYATIVDENQRQAIYAIQSKHNVTIDALKAALREAVDKRDAEVEAVLTPEQRTKLAATITELREQRRKAALDLLEKKNAGKEQPAPISKPDPAKSAE